MYGMDVNPLSHKFYLEALERDAVAAREAQAQESAPRISRQGRFAVTGFLRQMAAALLAWRPARTA